MAPPTTASETPLQWIRIAFGPTRIVALIDRALVGDVETDKLATRLAPQDRNKRYWVISMPAGLLNRIGAEFQLNITSAARVKAMDTYDEAEEDYADRASADAGKSVARGVKGLLRIGQGE